MQWSSAAPARSVLNHCDGLIAEEQARANLEDRIVFRAPTKSSSSNSGSKRSRTEEERPAKRNKVTGVNNIKLLSFDQEDEDGI